MRFRRLFRFLLETAFLAGLAALAAIAKMPTLEVIGVMAFGWVVVALAEWSSWLDRPHYGRGLPPRFYVPQLSLPPPRPIEQRPVLSGSGDWPAHVGDTRVTAAVGWATSMGEWPVPELSPAGDDTVVATPLEVDDTQIVRLPAPAAELSPRPARGSLGPPALPISTPPLSVPPPRAPTPPSPERAASPEPVSSPEPAPVLEPAPVAPPTAEPARAETEPALAQPAGKGLPAPETGAAARRVRVSHRVDPFSAAGGGSRLRRRRRESSTTVEVPNAPPPDRPLPSALRRTPR